MSSLRPFPSIPPARSVRISNLRKRVLRFGQGATFYVHLPLKNQEAEDAEAA